MFKFFSVELFSWYIGTHCRHSPLSCSYGCCLGSGRPPQGSPGTRALTFLPYLWIIMVLIAIYLASAHNAVQKRQIPVDSPTSDTVRLSPSLRSLRPHRLRDVLQCLLFPFCEPSNTKCVCVYLHAKQCGHIPAAVWGGLHFSACGIHRDDSQSFISSQLGQQNPDHLSLLK